MILVTGASGYVGKKFIEAYKKKFKIKTFSLQKESLEDLNLNNIKTIIHCAALVHQKKFHSQEEYDQVNVEYPLKLAKKAKESGVTQFVYLSTIAVYGNNNDKLTEKTKCFPLTPYGKSKLKAEEQLNKLNDTNFIISIIRPPMVYGKDAPGNIQTLISLVKKIPILPFANTNNHRSFLYIDNLTYMINCIIEKRTAGIFLSTDDKALSTTALITLIAKALNRNIQLINIPFFKILLKNVKPSLYNKLYGNLEIDNSETKKLLNYKNIYTVEEGIKSMIEGENQ